MSFNLKKIFDKVEEEKPEVEVNQNLPKDKFTKEQVEFVWQEFLAQLKAESKIPSYNALFTAKWNIKDEFQIEFEFSSLSTLAEFDVNKERLILEMRKKLNNFSIDFITFINNSVTENFIKTKPELFMEMAKKNPVLLKLKNEFGLDLNSND